MFTILGGILNDKLVVDLTVDGYLPVTDEQLNKNIETARGLGCKKLEPGPSVPLAIVGGGPTINDHVETLKNWNGHVWAINGAWKWCDERGIDATFCSVDPDPIVAKWAKGAKRALLATQCPPEAFETLKDADVITYEAGTEIKAVTGTTVSTLIYAGIVTKHSEITLFGCESCYLPASSHAYMREDRAEEMIVSCCGNFYLTAPDFYFQARALAETINGLGGYLKEESGGLLRAFVRDPKHWIAWMSEATVKAMRPV